MNILEEFAYDNLSMEIKSFGKDPEYDRALTLVSRLKQRLLDKLSPEETDLLEKYIDAQEEVRELTVVKSLIHGYRLGLTMTAEAFVGVDEWYRNTEYL